MTQRLQLDRVYDPSWGYNQGATTAHLMWRDGPTYLTSLCGISIDKVDCLDGRYIRRCTRCLKNLREFYEGATVPVDDRRTELIMVRITRPNNGTTEDTEDIVRRKLRPLKSWEVEFVKVHSGDGVERNLPGVEERDDRAV